MPERKPGDKPYGRVEYSNEFFKSGSSVFSSDMNRRKVADMLNEDGLENGGDPQGVTQEYWERSYFFKERERQRTEEANLVKCELDDFDKKLGLIPAHSRPEDD